MNTHEIQKTIHVPRVVDPWISIKIGSWCSGHEGEEISTPIRIVFSERKCHDSKNTKGAAEATNPVQGVTIVARLGHYHANILFRIVGNGNIAIDVRRFFNLLNPHLIHFTSFPVGVIVIDVHEWFSGEHGHYRGLESPLSSVRGTGSLQPSQRSHTAIPGDRRSSGSSVHTWPVLASWRACRCHHCSCPQRRERVAGHQHQS